MDRAVAQNELAAVNRFAPSDAPSHSRTCRTLAPTTSASYNPRMKKTLKIVGLVVLVLVLGVGGLLAATFMGRQSITDGADAGGMRIVKDGVVSVGMIPISDKEVALVDAGNDKNAKAILDELSRRHLGPDAVTTIMLTHGHPDHIGGVAMFPKAQVISLDVEQPLVEGRVGAKGPMTRLMPVSPTGITVNKAVKDGDTFMVGPHTVHVFAVPGHTQGSAAYLVDDVLFMGDAADTKSDGTVIGSPWVFSDSQPQDRESLVALDAKLAQANLPVKTIAFAHSGLLSNGRAPLDAYAAANR